MHSRDERSCCREFVSQNMCFSSLMHALCTPSQKLSYMQGVVNLFAAALLCSSLKPVADTVAICCRVWGQQRI